jgi:cytidine deaminase
MKELKFESKLLEYENENTLAGEHKSLLQIAKQNLINSYSPYSKFKVSCAILLDNGEIVSGTNQENIAYPSGLCAERVALFTAGAKYPESKPVLLAITAKSEKGIVNHPPTSCGACLQVMAETEMRFKHPITIILSGEEGAVYIAQGVKTFMPWQFQSNLV